MSTAPLEPQARQTPPGSTPSEGAPPRDWRQYALLLSAIIVAFFVQGVASPGRWGQIIVTCLLAVTLLLGLRVGETRPALMRVATGIAAAMILLSVIEAASGSVDDRATRIANALLVALAPPAIFLGVLRSLRAKRMVGLDAVLGVLCIYLLLGMLFAFVYGAIGRAEGGSFFAQGDEATVSACLYYSFTTLATVGYGDLTARTNLGHTLSVFEALVGQIYLVTIVSLLVANLGRRREPQA